jgi:hypothetical protein
MSAPFYQWTRLAMISIAFSLSAAGVAMAAPLSLKELEFLVRQRTPESEIIQQVKSRRLIAPLDAAALNSLKKNGATNSLISKLSVPGLAIDPVAAAAEARRQAETKARLEASLAEDAARRKAKDRQWTQTAEQLREARTVQGWLKDKLFTLNRTKLKPVEPKAIESVSIFGFFHGAVSVAPARDFAPKLAEAYGRLKKQYGNEVEIVFVSHDHDDFNQKEFLRTFGLTCPTMRVTSPDDPILQFLGDHLPWFVLVADNGKALSINGVNKEFIEPIQVLAGLEQMLASLHTDK